MLLVFLLLPGFPILTTVMLSQVRSIHFVGIGGTAMAAAAVALLEKGYGVTGSDNNVYEPMASFLASRKIAVMKGYSEEKLNETASRG